MIATLAMVAVPAVTIRLLHGLADRRWLQIDYGDLGGWLERTSLTDALTAIARVAALGLAYYVLISTVLYLIAVVSGSRSLIRLTRPLAIPIVKSLADRLIAGSIAIGALATPLLGSAPPPDLRPDMTVSADIAADYLPPSRLVDAVDSERLGDVPKPDVVSFTERPTTAAPSEAEDAADPDPTAASVVGLAEVTVRTGDHLWGLSESRLSQAIGRMPLDHEVAPYWREVVEINRERIRSGNPDLIQPGEVVILPDPTPFIPSGS